MSAPETPPGVYNERTALAWQRTALALLAGAAIVSRLALDRLGAVALVGVMVALPLTTWVMLEGRGRYRHDAGVRSRPRSRGGRAPTALALVTVLIALTELAAMAIGT